MGAVYRATDTKLGREVAIKVLPDEFAADRDRMARFTREAKVLASLNHPNIAAIYGVEERALVMELVEGPTLAERIARGPMLLEEVLPAARQIAEAIEYAHERGIIHRDLKPANIKVTPEGRIKVLDFGLAKALRSEAAPRDMELSQTLTAEPTVAGVILGTAAYMSPEQAKGKPVDRRADIWAFGVVMMEMLTGRRLYQGETVSETLAAVLLKEPDLGRLPKATPACVRTLIRRCLDRDQFRRLRDIGEARVILEQPESSAAEGAPTGRRHGGWIATGLLAAALTLVLYFRPADEPRVLRASVLPPKDGAFEVFTNSPAISPNGRQMAIVATTGSKYAIWLRDLDSLNGHWVPGTAGATYPFWSPDSRALGFFSGGKLKKVELAGGLVVNLCDAPRPAGGSWSQAGVLIFAQSFTAPIMRIPEGGGSPQPVTRQNEGGLRGQRFPWFLPDGRHFLYLSLDSDHEKSGIFVAALDSNENRRLVPELANAVYAPPGYLLYLRGSTLMAQPFDTSQTRLSGEAVAIAEKIDHPIDTFHGAFSASGNGVLLYSEGSGAGSTQLTWFDRNVRPDGTAGPPSSLQWPAISPDGKAIVVDQQDPGTGAQDLWLHDVARGVPARFTFNSALSRYAVWSPDGSHIAFVSNRDGFLRFIRRQSAVPVRRNSCIRPPRPGLTIGRTMAAI